MEKLWLTKNYTSGQRLKTLHWTSNFVNKFGHFDVPFRNPSTVMSGQSNLDLRKQKHTGFSYKHVQNGSLFLQLLHKCAAIFTFIHQETCLLGQRTSNLFTTQNKNLLFKPLLNFIFIYKMPVLNKLNHQVSVFILQFMTFL